VKGRKFTFDDVEIGAADTAGENFQEDVTGLWLGSGNALNLQRRV
jgi:hypothetical protein